VGVWEDAKVVAEIAWAYGCVAIFSYLGFCILLIANTTVIIFPIRNPKQPSAGVNHNNKATLSFTAPSRAIKSSFTYPFVCICRFLVP